MIKEVIALDLKVAKILEQVKYQAKAVSDVDCEIYYHMNEDKFSQPELRRLRHILITVNDEYTENRREHAYKRIKKVASALQRNRKDFSELAAKYSECPTALQGGELGWVKTGQLYADLERVAYELDVGETSGIVESALGFHIVRCEEIKPPRHIGFEEVRQKLKEKLTQRNQIMAQKAWLQQQVEQLHDKEANA
jgi:peptidyl-prolyl cis-trans isomerase C